jgi:type IV secretory pathway VirB10-like protein
MSDDPKISARYRELPREEPPRHLDEAILAAARRSVKPRRNWYIPLATAAVIVLAVAVTVHVERERPDDETAVAVAPAPAPREEAPAMQAPPPAAPAPEPKAERPAMKGFVPDPKPTPDKRRADDARAHADAERARAQTEVERLRAERQAREAGAASALRRERMEESRHRSSAASSALGVAAYRSPEQWLQGIADLRRQGRDDEADKALAEFRRAYPDYRIPEAMLEKVEKPR